MRERYRNPERPIPDCVARNPGYLLLTAIAKAPDAVADALQS